MSAVSSQLTPTRGYTATKPQLQTRLRRIEGQVRGIEKMVDEVFGEVFGLTVRSRNVGSQIGAGLKSLIGGELKGMTKMLGEGRQHAIERLVEEAEAKGANAIIAFRFDTSELGGTWTEICAYGTAVKARRATSS